MTVPEAPRISIATTPTCRGRRYSFPGLLHFTLDTYLIMLSIKQGGIKYHFLSLWYATQKLMLDSCKMVEKPSEAFHRFLWHFFQV